jgi:hypothetical protein
MAATAVAVTFFALYDPAGWTEHADLLAVLAAGDTELSAEAATALRAGLPAERRRRGEDYPSIGGAMATMCADTGSTGAPLDYPDLVDAADEEAPHFGRFRSVDLADQVRIFLAVAVSDHFRREIHLLNDPGKIFVQHLAQLHGLVVHFRIILREELFRGHGFDGF